MKALTERQREVFSYLQEYIEVHKYPPTIREMAADFNISPKGIHDHLKRLEEKNYIRCDFKRARAIELLQGNCGYDDKPDDYVKIPLLGHVAAGLPIFAEENFDRYLTLSSEDLRQGEHFALKISGESMRDAGILDGDIGVFLKRESADNGDIVIAMREDGRSTVKRFFKEKNRIKLKAENPAYPDIYASDIRILGKLQRIIRHYD